MKQRILDAGDWVQELRHSFDETFAQPPAGTAATEDLLGIRLAGIAYAIRLSGISGLFVDKKITRVPSQAAQLLGVAGFRGTILPVYDLPAVMGHPRSGDPRWLFIAADAPVAMAFDAFDGHLRVPHHAIAPADIKDGRRRFVANLMNADGTVRAVIDLPSVLENVTQHKPRGEHNGQ